MAKSKVCEMLIWLQARMDQGSRVDEKHMIVLVLKTLRVS